MEFLAWNMEHCFRIMKNKSDKIMLFMHLTNFSIFNNPPAAVTRETILILATCFPESLGNCVLWNAPGYFMTFFSMIKGFIDPKTVSKVFFLHGDISDGSANDRLMRHIIGEDWKDLTGAGQPSVRRHISEAHGGRFINASPGFDVDVHWPRMLQRERDYVRPSEHQQLLGAESPENSDGGLEEFNARKFRRIRRELRVGEGFLKTFVYSRLKPGGGKGENLMGYSEDNLLLVKEIKKGDHKSLLKVTNDYVDHITTAVVMTVVVMAVVAVMVAIAAKGSGAVHGTMLPRPG